MLLRLQSLDDSLFVRRGNSSKQRCLPRHLRKLRVGHRFDIAAQQNKIGGQTDLFADLLCDEFIVPGDDFH